MSAADARELIRQLEQDYPPHNFNGKPATYIYGLLDPETIECRYIGQSIRPAERYANHMNEISNCHRSHWLQSLKKRGLFPIMVVFERVDGEWPWQEAERYWIARGRALGWPLTNNTSGGDGIRDLAPEARARISAASRGRRHSPEAIEKLKIARRNRVTSAETRAKMSRSQRGRKITWTDRIAESLRKLGDDDVATIGRRLAAGGRLMPVGWDDETRADEFPCAGFKGCENQVDDDGDVCRDCQRRERDGGGCPGCGGNCQMACR